LILCSEFSRFARKKAASVAPKRWTVGLLWMRVESGGKGAKNPLHRFHAHRESSAVLQLNVRITPMNWFVLVITPEPSGFSTARGLTQVSSQRRERPLAPLLSHRLSVNQAKNLRQRHKRFIDDLLSIRSRTPRGNSEFLTKF
jgi:hypothetical protein